MAHPEGRARHDQPMSPLVASTPPWSPASAALLLLLNVSWAIVMARFGRGDIYWVVGVHALAVLVVVAVVTTRGGVALRQLVTPRARDVVVGLAAGVGMTVATYGAFHVARAIVPELAVHVARLYRAAGTETPAIALGWTLVILTGEELLWRGAWIDTWAPRLGPAGAAVTGVLAFALTQLGSGSVIVAIVALVCGVIWTWLRLQTGRVVASLIAHAIWTPVVILLHPVV